MYFKGFRISLAALVVLSCLCGGIGAFTREEWLSIIGGFQQHIKTYSASLDVSDWAQDFIEGTRVLPPGHPTIFGKQEYLSKFQAYVSGIGHCTDEITESELVVFTCDMAVNRMRFTRRCVDGSSLTGKGVFVLKKVNGRALILVDIWNYDS